MPLPAGEAAEALEQRSAAEAARRVMRLLRGIFEPQGVEVPAPLQVGRLKLGLRCMAWVDLSFPGLVELC